ncbi:MAG: glycerol dehydrogenase [Spirochaetales bacterium]|jgi:glycerol dehydrogenase|nr:glycerol dehydrogenase [Spirochaetales bacterium]
MMPTTTRAFGAPMTYIQGPGEFNNLEAYSRAFSGKVFFLIDNFLFPDFSRRVEEIYKDTESSCVCEQCRGECSRSEIFRVAELIKKSGAGLVVGVGGGKTIDVAKMAANELSLPYFITPTSASTDAPVSCIAVIYTDSGEHAGVASLKRAAEIVLMDSEIIAKAPLRLFRAGMADALATWFEAQTRERSDTPNNIGKGYRRCKAGMAIAKLSFELLMEDGLKALQALENGVITEAVENIIETNTLLSGLGFQNTGCSVAHAIHAGLAELPQTHSYMHGEKVAFGIVCGFIFENMPKEIVDTVMRFMTAAGLPVTLKDLNVEPTRENAFKIADKVVNRNKTIYAEPLVITVDTVLAAVLAANALGEAYQKGKA